jgi:hypothetical protein
MSTANRFKYRPIWHCYNYDRRMDYISNCSGTIHPKLHSETSRSAEDKRREFFINYQQHSVQLVDSLIEWGRKVRFTSCQYEQGLLDIDFQEPVESMNKGFMRYMKKHLEKEEVYQPILALVGEIETSHKQLCEKIQNIMISEDPMNHSFQRVIIGKIQSTCPTLKRSKDINLKENNIYLDTFIFKIIFEKVSRKESTINLIDEPANIGDNRVLTHQKLFAIGQGKESDIRELKRVVEQLLLDIDIKKKVEQYTELHKQLINYQKINELKNNIEELGTYIQGGGYLSCNKDFTTCDLCDPSKLAPK